MPTGNSYQFNQVHPLSVDPQWNECEHVTVSRRSERTLKTRIGSSIDGDLFLFNSKRTIEEIWWKPSDNCFSSLSLSWWIFSITVAMIWTTNMLQSQSITTNTISHSIDTETTIDEEFDARAHVESRDLQTRAALMKILTPILQQGTNVRLIRTVEREAKESSSVDRRRVSCESLNKALLRILFRLYWKFNVDWHSSRRFFQRLPIIWSSPKNCTCLVSMVLFSLWNPLKVSCSNCSLISLTRRTTIVLRGRERIHDTSPSNSLLDHIFRLNEFINIDQQKKISRSVPQAIQVTPSSEKTKFLGHSTFLEDASDASFDRRSISRWWQPIDLGQRQWNRSIVVHCHSNALKTRSARLHCDS